MKLFGRTFFERTTRNEKASAAASVMVNFLIGRPQHERRNYEKAAREAYIQNVIANRCINMIAVAAASVDLKLYSGSDSARTQVDENPLLDLLYRPNPRQGDDSFFRDLYSKFLVGGEVFVERVVDGGQAVKELWIHRPDRMTVTAGVTALPVRYTYEANGQKKTWECNPITGDSDILHVRNFNPIDDWRGLSAIDPAAYSLDQHNEASAWNYGLLKNGARPSGALMVKSTQGNVSATLSDQQFKRLKLQLEETMSGGANAGRPMLLEGDMDWKEFSLNPKDMDYVNVVQEATRNIARAFGIPPILLGIPGDSTYNNIREAKLAFWEDTVLPLINLILCEFNHWLVPKFGAGIWLDVNKDEISALSLRKEENRKSLQMADYLTINEKRVADGKEVIPGGDVVLVESSKIPVQMAGVAYQSTAATNYEDPGDMSKGEYESHLLKNGVPPLQAQKVCELVYGA